MTRKHYRLIAKAINQAYLDGGPLMTPYGEGVLKTSERIADALEADNQAFDRNKFLTACGVA